MSTKPQSFKTSIDLPKKTRDAMIVLCNQQLADTGDLHSQIKQAHWNVKGSQFIALHKLYDDLAGEMLDQVDMIAERATALGGLALGTARMAAANSRLEEYPLDSTDSLVTVKVLVNRYAAYAASTREAIDVAARASDQGTSDMFTEVSRAADKALWFLEAHLQS